MIVETLKWNLRVINFLVKEPSFHITSTSFENHSKETTSTKNTWKSYVLICSSIFSILPYSCTHSSHSLMNLVNFLLAHIPLMKESHSLGRPFKVVIITSASSTMSPIDSNCSLIRDTLEKYDCIFYVFCTFTPLILFLKVILLLMFLPSNILVSALNISFGIFFEDTWGIKWSLIELVMILLNFIISFLCLAFSSSPYSSLTSSLI